MDAHRILFLVPRIRFRDAKADRNEALWFLPFPHHHLHREREDEKRVEHIFAV
jgi:hypothetical protein